MALLSTHILLILLPDLVNQLDLLNPFLDRTDEHHYSEIVNQLSWTFVSLCDQSNFKFQIRFICSLDKRSGVESVEEDTFIELNFIHFRTLSAFESAASKLKEKLQRKIENERLKEFGWVFHKIRSMQNRFVKNIINFLVEVEEGCLLIIRQL